MAITVSIIVPIFNAQNTIERCIKSVLGQTYTDWELLLINDGSKDASLEICDKYTSDKRIRVITQNNSGVSAARNKGISLAQGEFVVFVDADDWMPDDALECLVSRYGKTKCELIIGSYLLHKNYGRKNTVKYDDGIFDVNDKTVWECLRNYHTAPWGKLFLARIIKEYDIIFPQGIPYAEDSVFLIDYLRYCNSLATCERVVYEYDFTGNNQAMKKFYPLMYKYQLIVKNSLIEGFNIKNTDTLKSIDEDLFYNQTLGHYITHNECRYIEDACAAWKISISHDECIRMWKSKNRPSLFKKIIRGLRRFCRII